MAHLSRGQDLAWLSAVPDSAEFLINKQIIRRELNRERKYKCQSEIKIIATRGCSRQRWALIISRTPPDSLGERSVWLSAVRESAQRCSEWRWVKENINIFSKLQKFAKSSEYGGCMELNYSNSLDQKIFFFSWLLAQVSPDWEHCLLRFYTLSRK